MARSREQDRREDPDSCPVLAGDSRAICLVIVRARHEAAQGREPAIEQQLDIAHLPRREVPRLKRLGLFSQVAAAVRACDQFPQLPPCGAMSAAPRGSVVMESASVGRSTPRTRQPMGS